MASPPTTLTAVPGDKIAATAYNAGGRDPIDFLLDPPRCHVNDATGLVVTNGGTTLMTWSGEVYDTDSMHDAVSNTSRITFNTDGYYEVTYSIQLPNATYTESTVDCRLGAGGNIANGTNINQQNTNVSRNPRGTFTRAFTTGDYIEFWITQTSGASRTTVTGNFRTFASARWVAIP